MMSRANKKFSKRHPRCCLRIKEGRERNTSGETGLKKTGESKFQIHLIRNEEVEMAVREWLRNLKYIHRDRIFSSKLVPSGDKFIIALGEYTEK